MEAKETVMVGNITSLEMPQQRIVDKLLLKQAEISFKAGQESGCYAEGWINGIEEVVEWIESNHTLVEKRIDWQAKLKEWGIDA